nr:SdrD B-like domain-containing protein [Corynebacterium silvaticum]
MFKVNNDAHPLWSTSDSKAPAWKPPAELTIEIPASVKKSDGTPSAGTITVTSGRLADVALKDELDKATFVSNEGKGTCTWDATYETKLVKQDVGYWVQNVLIGSNPEEVRDYSSLPYEYQNMVRYRPTLINGEVSLGDRQIGKIQPIYSGKDDRLGYLIGDLNITENVPPFTSSEWLEPTVPVKVTYSYTNPCGMKVDEKYVRENPPFVGGPSNGSPYPTLQRDYTYVEASGVYVGLVRPPEEASATAQFVFNQDLVSLGDYVWFDRNADGKQGDIATEPGVGGVKVSLLYADGKPVNKPGTSEPYTVTTDDSGKYLFEKLPKGMYKVQFDATNVLQTNSRKESQLSLTSPQRVQLLTKKDGTDSDVIPEALISMTDAVDLQQDRTDIDAGLIAKARFSVSKILDGTDAGKQVGTTERELQDGKLVVEHKITVKNETPGIAGKAPQVLDEPLSVPGFEVESLTVDGNPIQKTGNDYLVSAEKDVTADNEKQEYLVKVTYKRAAGNTATGALTKAEADAIGQCSDQSGTTKGIVNKVYLGDDKNEADADAEKDKNNWDCVPVKGVDEPVGSVSVGDFVWVDANENGIQDAGEEGLADVTLEIVGPDGKPVTDVNGTPVKDVTTRADGKYTFSDLPVLEEGQKYTVRVVDVPEGYEPTKTGEGTTDTDSSTDEAETVADLTKPGAEDNSLDFGFIQAEDPNKPDFPDDEDPEGPSFNWKYLIPLALIPVIGALVWGSSQGSSAPGTPAAPALTAPQGPGATSAPATTAPQTPASAAPKAPMKKQLAATGASVLYTLLAALLLVIAGVFLVRLRRQD